MGPFEHITSVQPHQLHQFGSSSGRDSNGHLNMPSIHAQLGTGTGLNEAGTTNGGSISSSSADALKPQSGGEVVNLAFLDLYNYGSFSGHQGMGAFSYRNSGTGASPTVGVAMEKQGQKQAFDLATNFPTTNGYLPPTSAAVNQIQNREIDPTLPQRVPVLPSQVTPVPSNGTAVVPDFGTTRQVSQPPVAQLPPVHEQMVGVERTGFGRLASVQPRGLGGIHSHHSSHPHTHSRGWSVVVSPHELMVKENVEGERRGKRAIWGSGTV